MKIFDQVKYDLGQKVYAYDEGKIIEGSIWSISVSNYGVVYEIELDEQTSPVKTSPTMSVVETSDDYIEFPQEHLFTKKSDVLAYAIKEKNAQLQNMREKLGIDELGKELAEAKEEEKRNEEKIK